MAAVACRIGESAYANTMDKPPETKSEIRQDYFRNRFVVIAPKRNLRPDSFAGDKSSHKQETAASPAIELDPAILSLDGVDGQWAVKVIANGFPALSLDNAKAYGTQEIVVETPKHNTEFSELSTDQILLIFEAYRQRTAALLNLKSIEYVLVFKNDGHAAGASLPHSHSQIMAISIPPTALVEEAVTSDRYVAEHQNCPYCDLLIWEEQQKVRVIYEDKHILAISPYAAEHPFEVWILPRQHHHSFLELNGQELASVAVILKKLTVKLDQAMISYNFFLQNSLSNRHDHFVLKLEPRPNVWAGFELGTGIIINPVTPEYAALWYKGQV